MEQHQPETEEPQAVVLYDFLYQDDRRLNSYFAQVFKGRLASMEQTDQTRKTDEAAAKASIAFLGTDYKNNSEALTGIKRVIDPHDFNALNIVSFLFDGGYLKKDIENAANGDLVSVEGQFILIDSSIAKSVIEGMIDSSVPGKATYLSKNSPEYKKQQEELATAKSVQKLFQSWLATTKFPTGFALAQSNAQVICGTLHEQYLHEPVLSYQFKHGARGLADVHVIGIKEESENNFPFIEGSNFLDLSAEMLSHFETILFPPDGIRVTPILIFRTLNVPSELAVTE